MIFSSLHGAPNPSYGSKSHSPSQTNGGAGGVLTRNTLASISSFWREGLYVFKFFYICDMKFC